MKRFSLLITAIGICVLLTVHQRWPSVNAQIKVNPLTGLPDLVGTGGSSATPATQTEAITGTNDTAMITPLSAGYAITGAGGCGVVRTSATVVTIFPGASASTPCNFQFGDVRRQFTSTATVTLAASAVSTNASAAWVYVKGDGVVYVGLASAFDQTKVTCSGCTKETPITDVPANAVGVYKLLAGTTDDNWDTFSSSWTNLISLRQFAPITCSTGATCTQDSNGLRDIQVDGTIATKAGVQVDSYRGGLTAGSSTAYTLDLTPDLAAYPSSGTNPCFSVKFHTASGSSPTLAIDGLAAKKLYKLNGTSAPAQIAANELQATTYAVCWDSALDSSAGGFTVAIGAGGGTRTVNAYWPVASCTGDGGSPYLGSNIRGIDGGGSLAPSCPSGTGAGEVDDGYVSVADGGDVSFLVIQRVPSTFSAMVSVQFYFANAVASNNVAWKHEIYCVADGDQWILTPAPTFTNTLSTQTKAVPASANKRNHASAAQTAGCTAGELMYHKFIAERSSGSDSNTGGIYVLGFGATWTETN